MSKPRSRQPANDARARRRSLVELTAVASRTVEEDVAGTLANAIAGSRSAGSQIEHVADTAEPTTISAALERSGVTSERANAAPQFHPADSITDVSIQIAEDIQTRALEGMKDSMHAALDYAKNLARTHVATSGASSASSAAAADDATLDVVGVAAECRAAVFELMKVNAGATLEYARELGSASTLSEFVELSSTHARRQCELVLKQAEVLKSLARNVTGSDPE